MASVQNYICDAEIFPLHIIHKHASLEDVEKERHFAALIIQRVWRGYLVRKEIARWHQAATVIQKHIRGFLLRWHLPEILKAYKDWYRLQFYNKMATKIQALWRGYFFRRDRISIKDLLAQKRAIEEANANIIKLMREAFENMEKLKRQQMEKEAQQWVLFILFKLHHLLRTSTQEGIYSMHGKKELSCVEELLKVLPLGEYMRELREIYYDEIKKPVPAPPYTFKDKALNVIEDNYRKRDRSREVKQVFVPDRNIHSKPFVFNKRIAEKAYERWMLCSSEKYPGTKFTFARKTEKSKHVSDKDFDLHVLKKLIFELQPPAYYIDFWSKICDAHNLPDL